MNTRLNQSGSINVLLVPLIISVIFLLSAIGFGAWAFTQRSDYKNNSDAKADAAVTVAVEKANTAKDNEFLEKEKEPLKSYSSPAQYGSFAIKYPKIWSAYSTDNGEQTTLIMQPDVIATGSKVTYALKVEVLSTSYAQSISPLDGIVKQGKLTAKAYSLPKVSSVTGLRVDGQISGDKSGAAVYLPLRDKTIKISCETNDRLDDFNNIILPNFTYSP